MYMILKKRENMQCSFFIGTKMHHLYAIANVNHLVPQFSYLLCSRHCSVPDWQPFPPSFYWQNSNLVQPCAPGRWVSSPSPRIGLNHHEDPTLLALKNSEKINALHHSLALICTMSNGFYNKQKKSWEKMKYLASYFLWDRVIPSTLTGMVPFQQLPHLPH